MKIEITKDKASRLINCGEVVLISASFEGKNTITTCAWHLPLSKEPPLVGIALVKRHFSSELIKKSEEFIINIPPWPLLDKVIFCGSVSGRNHDKFKEAQLSPQKANHLAITPRIKECIGHLECSLWDIKEVGDHNLFLGEVVFAEAEGDYFINDFWDTRKVDLIFHLGSKFFFKSNEVMTYGSQRLT